MKKSLKFYHLWGIIALFLVASLPSSLQSAQDGNGGYNKDEVFSLEPLDEDTPSIRKYKAALRIFAGVQTVYHLSSKCNATKSWKQYEKRNGNTLAQVVKNFSLGGGMGVPQKIAVDAYTDGQMKEALSTKACAGLMADIDSQVWDIYKGDRFSEDYGILRER
jgi:hypothetical protein